MFSQASITKDLKRTAEKSKTPNSMSREALALAMDRFNINICVIYVNSKPQIVKNKIII